MQSPRLYLPLGQDDMATQSPQVVGVGFLTVIGYRKGKWNCVGPHGQEQQSYDLATSKLTADSPRIF